MFRKLAGKTQSKQYASQTRRPWFGVLLPAVVIYAAICAAYAPTPAWAVEPDGDDKGYGAPWWTVGSGGGQSSGGGYLLRGTVGKPEAAAISGGGYTVRGGFWRTAPRQPLTVQPLADQTAPVGSLVSMQVIARDPVGSPLHYSADGLPPGLQIDSTIGLIGGQLAEGSAGVYPVTVAVTNGRGASAQAAFTFTVTEPAALEPEDEPAILPHIYLPLVAQ